MARGFQVIASVYEDPPLLASELTPAVGHSIWQTIAGPIFKIWHKCLGARWFVGDAERMHDAIAHELPSWITRAMTAMVAENQDRTRAVGADSFWNGLVAAGCDHENMLKHVKRLVEGGGHPFTYKSFPSFPQKPHSIHGHDPACYVVTVTAWLEERVLRKALNP